jgi:lysine 2,3-aminomutase
MTPPFPEGSDGTHTNHREAHTEMETWRQALAESIIKPEELATHLDVDPAAIADVVAEYPMRITPMWMKLIKEKGDPFWRQVVPEPEELADDSPDDPLHEDLDSPVPHLVHRYPDRVLFMVTNQCPIYCRFCTRKRLVGKPGFLKKGELDRVVEYLTAHPEVRDIILSGGDPLLLPDHLLERILKALRAIPHIELIRIGSRVPGSLPERITPALCEMVKKYHPIYMNLHFNHPDELTPEVKAACGRLADAGVPLGAQTVLLKGVNDDPAVMLRLVHQLLLARVKPYYLYQADLTRGTNHFRTSVETGLEIIKALQGHTSGMAVPHFVIDAPEGGGKIPLLPGDYLVNLTPDEAVLRNYEGNLYSYPQPDRTDGAPARSNGNGNGARRELPMVAAPSTGCGIADDMLR